MLAVLRVLRAGPEWHSRGICNAVMIPISDDNPARLTPIVSWAILLACVAVFVWEYSLGEAMTGALYVYGFTPDWFFHPATLPQELPPDQPAITLFTSMFLHGGVLHLLGNMLYLWIFANNVEDAMGHIRFTLFYVLCGVAAALTFGIIEPSSRIPMVGASGAISGVLAAYVLLYPRAHVRVIVPLGIIFYPMTVSAIVVIGFWFLMQLLSAAMSDPTQPGTAFWAHVGGFGAGIVLTPFLKSRNYSLFGQARRGPWG